MIPTLPPVYRDGYVVNQSWCPGVIIIWGALPVNDFAMFANEYRKGVLSTALGMKWNAHVLVRSAKLHDELMARFCPKPAPGAGIEAWLNGPDVGLSALVIVKVLTGRDHPALGGDLPVPLDAGDFGRCLALLEAEPSLRPRIAEMRAASTAWSRIADQWDQLESLHRSDRKKFNLFLDALGRGPK